jgi:replicative DNA helicase
VLLTEAENDEPVTAPALKKSALEGVGRNAWLHTERGFLKRSFSSCSKDKGKASAFTTRTGVFNNSNQCLTMNRNRNQKREAISLSSPMHEAEFSLICCALDDHGIVSEIHRHGGTRVLTHPVCIASLRHIESQFSVGKSADVVTLSSALKDAGIEKPVETAAEIESFCPATGNALEYLKICSEKAYRRRVIEAAKRMIEAAENEEDIYAVRQECETDVLQLSNAVSGERALSDIVNDVLCATNEDVLGISTGFPSLDERIDGLVKGQKIVIAAPRSGGKSSLASSMMVSLMARGVPCIYFSFEMPDKQAVKRMLQNMARVTMRRVARNQATLDECAAIHAAADKLRAAKAWVSHEQLSIAGIRARCAQLVSQGLRVAFIDYLQIIGEPRRKDENRTDQLDRMSRETKQMAMNMGLTVVELSQLTFKDGESKTRGSTAIENDCDVLLKIKGEGDKVEIEIAKGRDSGIGSCELGFDRPHMRFYHC